METSATGGSVASSSASNAAKKSLSGVAGLGVPFGLELDHATVHNDGKDDADMLMLAINDVLKSSMGAAAISHVTTQMHVVDGKAICRVHVRPCAFPVEAQVTELDKTAST